MVSLFIDEPIELNTLPDQLKAQKKDRFFIVKSLTELTQNFNKGEISKEVFTLKSKEIISKFDTKHSEIVITSKSLKRVKSDSEIFRFRSLKIFTSELGLVLSLFMCSFIILTLAFLYVDNKGVRIITYFAGGLLIIPSVFYSLWIFTTEIDLSQGHYIFTFILISVGVSFITFFVYKLLLQVFMKRINLKTKIATLLNLVASIKYDHFSNGSKIEQITRIHLMEQRL